MIDKANKSFCILPWVHVATNSSGNLRLCCNSTPLKNLILKENKSPFNISKDKISDAWNSNSYKSIRKKMLAGEKIDICSRCYDQEANQLESPRQGWNKKWIESNKNYEVQADFKVKYFDLRLGNLCNLKCRMCNPYASNQWIKEWGLVEEKLSTKEEDRLRNLTWPEEDITWDNIKVLANSVEEIYLTGGEPTIIKKQYELLDYFIQNGQAKKIKLKYNTNLVKLPDDLVLKWEKFKSVKINCSIDAYGDLNDYIRHPSKWKQVESNLKKLIEINKFNLEIHCTVQMYNIIDLDKFLKWSSSLEIPVYLNILNHPKYLNIRVLPEEVKEVVADKLRLVRGLNKKVDGIINYMNTHDWSSSLSSFKRYTFALDKSRGQTLKGANKLLSSKVLN